MTVEGATRRKKARAAGLAERARRLPEPALPSLAKPYDLLVTGVGGTGVITVGAVVAMAAHLEGRGVTVLDFTGFAQKFGSVLSYVRIGDRPEAVNQARIDQGSADALIGCDIVVSSSPKASSAYRRGMKAVVNSAEMPTGDVVRFRDADLAAKARLAAIGRVVGDADLSAFDANALAERLLGDAVFANMMMLGFAWQKGLVPTGLEALMRAIELNGVEVDKNIDAFAAGRLAAAEPDFARAAEARPEETLEEIITRRVAFLTDYQDEAWARRYRAMIERVRAAEKPHGSEALAGAAARALFKLMSYKDEYEVARLHMESGFLDELRENFEGDFKVVYHLAPPFLAAGRDARGRPLKRRFGPWIQTPMRALARMRRLRGGVFDLFGYSAERRAERELIGWYEGLLETLIVRLRDEEPRALLAIAEAPMEIRGYGPVKEEAIQKVRADVANRLRAAEPSKDQRAA